MIPSAENKTATYSAAGKLMLFGEYLVLNGARSLAFPLKFGQSMEIIPSPDNYILWSAYSPDGLWFLCKLDAALNIIETNNDGAAQMLQKLFAEIKTQNPDLSLIQHFSIKANFNLQWGLGSSSTFISLLGQWSGVDPYFLLAKSFGGSGYDIACATAKKPVLYQIVAGQKKAEEVQLSSEITDYFLFVYLGQKQNSRDEIRRFERATITNKDIEGINSIVDAAIQCTEIEAFEVLLNRSEDILSPILGREKIKDSIFADYKYSVKSLGAWGGDFFLATFRDLNEARIYFNKKGLNTMFTYKELVI